MALSSLKSKISNLPQSPGVYVFRDVKNEIIYIGKATDLRLRVGSYFRDVKSWGLSPHKGDLVPEYRSRPIEEMIHRVADIEVQETESVLEALILESNLIKKYQPKYNVKEKDDKSFSYFVITNPPASGEFPRVLIMRKTELDKNTKHNPEYSGQITNKTQKLQTTNEKMADKKLVMGRTVRRGGERSAELEYAKIFGPYTSKRQMEIALKIIRKIFPFHSNNQKTEKGCLDFQMGRCPGPYAGAISKEDYAKNIRGIQMILEGKKKSLLKSLEKEMQILAGKNEFEKAAQVRNKIFALKHIQDVALMTQETLAPRPHPSAAADTFSQREKGNMEKIFRLEAYDISNISGQQAVGSMVVFENNQPNKKEYRKFRIKTVEGANDVAMTKEVLTRRFNNPWTQPDLILLDGGQGHLNMAEKLLYEMGLVIPLAAVAKGASRKNVKIQSASWRTNFKSNQNVKIQKILEDKNLVKYVMDEAHRFAIGYHRKIRKREFI